MSDVRELDILDMPFEGLAAYWLSIKKLLDTKKTLNVVEQEIEHTPEPFIRCLLELYFSHIDMTQVRRLTEDKRDYRLRDYERKLQLMRMTSVAVAKSENPRLTLVRMLGLFAKPPIQEQQAFDMAGGLIEESRSPGANMAALLRVDHQDRFDRLVVKLLHYVIRSRREGGESLAKHLEHVGFPYLAEGLALAVDGFEAGFIEAHMDGVARALLEDTRRKMDMSMEMAAAIRKKLVYEEVFRIARVYLP